MIQDTLQEIKSIKDQILDLQKKEHQLFTKMLSEIDETFFSELRGKIGDMPHHSGDRS